MNDQKNIKNVILDLGGVLVDIDPELTYAEFKRILKPEVKININWVDNITNKIKNISRITNSVNHFENSRKIKIIPYSVDFTDIWI